MTSLEPRAKLDSVLENWTPRFLANGIDYLDVRRILASVQDWSDWGPAWEEAADRYEELGRTANAEGRTVTAGEHLKRAALLLHFAQFVLTESPSRREALHRRQVRIYEAAASLLAPAADRVDVPYEGLSLPGYLRIPRGVTNPGLAVLIPGLESTKEQFSTYEPYFLERGVATLSFEGPGQGEARYHLPFRCESYGTAMAALADFVGTLDSVDSRRVVVVGTSFGGFLALRYGWVFPGLAGIVDIAGFFDLSSFDELQEVTQEALVHFVGAADKREAKRLLEDVTLDPAVDDIDVPVLILHGAQDRIVRPSEAERIAERLGARATVRIEPDGGHSCNNLAPIIRPAVADWVAEALDMSRTAEAPSSV